MAATTARRRNHRTSPPRPPRGRPLGDLGLPLVILPAAALAIVAAVAAILIPAPFPSAAADAAAAQHQQPIAVAVQRDDEKPNPSPPAPIRKVIAVGDLHGDLPHATRVLQMAGIVDDALEWAAEDGTVFVQTGDVVDRGPDTIALYRLLQRLHASRPSAVHPLLGNHEVMNMANDLRYVTREDTASFGGAAARRAAFAADGWIGAWLRGLNVSAVVDRSVFVHGGILPAWVAAVEGDEEKKGKRKKEDGEREGEGENATTKGKVKGVDRVNGEAGRAVRDAVWRAPVLGGDGPLWYRGFAQDDERTVCKILRRTLRLVDADRMVIGHTPQYETGRVLSRCGGRVFVIDVGISAYYGGHCAALEIAGENVTALYCADGGGVEGEGEEDGAGVEGARKAGKWRRPRQVRVDLTPAWARRGKTEL
ncbi:Metallo-dependent phosphatase-like protein [Zopfochytrium polystomum]|nr:Metallo-dependent phosphatase-like protein [Zopfochytrium polystomum]